MPNTAGKPLTSTVYTFAWLSSPATMLVFAGLLVIVLYRVSPAVAVRELAKMVHKLRFAFLTVASVLALAYVMNQSGQTITIGNWIAGAGAAFAFLSPVLGWLGTAVTGSDASANALFRHPAAGNRHQSRHQSSPGCGGEHLRRRCRQDDQPTEPDHRRRPR